MSGAHKSSVEVRKSLDFPVIDADAHVVEAPFAFMDFLKQVAGPDLVARFGKSRRRERGLFWAIPSGKYTMDRATVMLPRLYAKRLEEAGIDFAVVYTTMGIGSWMHLDDEMRLAMVRALNMMYADMFKDVKDKLTVACVIPMGTPQEAIGELEYCVKTLGYKAASIGAEVRRTIPGAELGACPQVAHYIDSLTIDSKYDYDPFWAKCVELGVAPSTHSSVQGSARRNSPTNYVYNRLGDFGVAGEHACRSLFLGGVTRRFPTLKVAFLEGGVAWAAQLYNDLFEFWGKRNIKYLKEVMDPANLDVDLMERMFRENGNAYLTPERIRAQPDLHASTRNEDPNRLDDFAACDIKTKRDIYDLFIPNFYFGCEADDRMIYTAFNDKVNHEGAKLKALFSSDIGHWDVVDMTEVLEEVWEAHEHGAMSEEDFKNFVFASPAEFHASMNPDFFKGTAVEGAVAKLMAEQGFGASAKSAKATAAE
jgi:predicted TIM-barrel fold metal-dependent hydrolase